MSIPKVINYVWVGGKEKPKKIEKCIKTWREIFKDYEFVEWNEQNFDINCNKFVQKAYEQKKWAFVSDYIRAYVIYNNGGIYFDTDILAIKNIDDMLENRAFIGYESDKLPFTAVFGAEKGHPLIKDILEHFENENYDFETPNTEWITDILVNKYDCKLGNKEQVLKEGIKVYKKELLCEPSSVSRTVHVFTGTWIENKSIFSKIATFLRLHSNNLIARKLYISIVLKMKNRRVKK